MDIKLRVVIEDLREQTSVELNVVTTRAAIAQNPILAAALKSLDLAVRGGDDQ